MKIVNQKEMGIINGFMIVKAWCRKTDYFGNVYGKTTTEYYAVDEEGDIANCFKTLADAREWAMQY